MSFCFLYNVVSENHNVQNSPWGGGGSIASSRSITLLDENPGLTPRERAAEERHLIAAASSNVPLLVLSDRGSSFVNRDEEVFTTNDGQTIRHPKSRRLQSPEEEVVLDYEDDLEM